MSYRLHPVSDICLELIYVSLCWSANIGMFMCVGSSENVADEFVFISLVMLHMSCSSNLDGLWDGRQETVRLLFCGVLGVLLASRWRIITIVLTLVQCERHPILFYQRDQISICSKTSLIPIGKVGILTLLLVDEILLPRYMNLCTNSSSYLKNMKYTLSVIT